MTIRVGDRFRCRNVWVGKVEDNFCFLTYEDKRICLPLACTTKTLEEGDWVTLEFVLIGILVKNISNGHSRLLGDSAITNLTTEETFLRYILIFTGDENVGWSYAPKSFVHRVLK